MGDMDFLPRRSPMSSGRKRQLPLLQALHSVSTKLTKRMIRKSFCARQKNGMSLLGLLSRNKYPTQIYPSPGTDRVPGMLIDKSPKSLLK